MEQQRKPLIGALYARHTLLKIVYKILNIKVTFYNDPMTKYTLFLIYQLYRVDDMAYQWLGGWSNNPRIVGLNPMAARLQIDTHIHTYI